MKIKQRICLNTISSEVGAKVGAVYFFLPDPKPINIYNRLNNTHCKY